MSSASSCEPIVSTVGLGSSESCSAASPISEQAFRPQFTLDQHRGASGSLHLVLTADHNLSCTVHSRNF